MRINELTRLMRLGPMNVNVVSFAPAMMMVTLGAAGVAAVAIVGGAACSKNPATATGSGGSGSGGSGVVVTDGGTDVGIVGNVDAQQPDRPAVSAIAAFDWNGVIGTGQSLSVGEQAP